MRVETRDSGGVAGPAKWAAVGALGGAAVMGVIGAMVLRQPRELAAAERAPTPVHAFVARQEPPAPPSIAPAPVPQTSSSSSAVPLTSQPAEPKPQPAKEPSTPEPEPAAPSVPTPAPAPEPTKAPASSPKPPSPAAPKTPAGKLNVNKANQAELELLPGIGPAMAKRIIEYRMAHGPFKRVEDLDNVKGIGAKTLDKLRPLVTVE